MSRSYDVAVIGAGVFGAWTAWHLARAGKRVLLVDAWGAAHSRASSGGETRILRVGYGADEIYTRMAMRSREMWLELFARSGQELFLQTGALRISREDDAYSSATRETLERLGAPYETVSLEEMTRRWPQFRLAGSGTYGLFELESGALLARRAVALVVSDAIKRGVDAAIQAVAWPNPQIDARTFVFACGPWLPKLFPEIVGSRIFVTRQEVFWFAPPPGNSSFDWRRFPVWTDFTDPRGPYGFPDIERRGVKLAFDKHGEPFDPDQGSRNVTTQGLTQARRFLAERFPTLADSPLTESRVCQYANTSTGDFLIDRHPAHREVWLVGGGSGHGFKHGPAVGEYVAAQILATGAAEPRFALQTKSESQQRAVY